MTQERRGRLPPFSVRPMIGPILKDRRQRGHYHHRNDTSKDSQRVRPPGEDPDPLALDVEVHRWRWSWRFVGRRRRVMDGAVVDWRGEQYV